MEGTDKGGVRRNLPKSFERRNVRREGSEAREIQRDAVRSGRGMCFFQAASPSSRNFANSP